MKLLNKKTSLKKIYIPILDKYRGIYAFIFFEVFYLKIFNYL